ncbi:MAG: hypothetical protein ACXWJ3_19090, partial [Caldimonas sp.]
LVGIVEGYRTARVNIDETRSFDVPMPGETFLSPPSKIRAFLLQSGIGKLAGLRPGPSSMASSGSDPAPVARQQ